MDIAEHMNYHDPAIRGWLAQQGIWGEFHHDAYQNIREAMIEAHEKGWYDHDGGELFTYVFPYLRGIAFRGYVSEWRYGIKDELDMLQEMSEKAHGRYSKGEELGDKVHLDPLYESPIAGLREPRESTLTAAEQEQAEYFMGKLTDESLERLLVSYDHSERSGAAYFGEPKSTYRYRLEKAREEALALLRILNLDP